MTVLSPGGATIAAIRFGYGLPLPPDAPVTAEAMLAGLAAPDRIARRFPAPALAEAMPLIAAWHARRRAAQGDPAQDPAIRAAMRDIQRQTAQGTSASFMRALAAPDGLRERLVRFWADHFTVVLPEGRYRALPFALVEDAIRPQITARFVDMLRAVTLHPAMLVYLNQVDSVGPGSAEGRRRSRGLNENLARELIELHTLGVGASYAQTDVRELAELLTGLGLDETRGFIFRAPWAEPGAETVLGRRYAGKGLTPIHSALYDLALHPDTARHIARKLAVHFVADTPDPALVTALEQAFLGSDGSLMAVYAALLGHPAAWGPPGGKVRQPFDFLIAGLRALGVGAGELADFGAERLNATLLDPLRLMGQPWLTPRGPDGWAENAAAWITPQGLGARIAWAMEMPVKLRPDLPDPVALAARALGDAAGERLLWAAGRAENLRDGVGLVFASPEFNRR